jgi:N-acetylglutamate synthase-like GNAT family acetyltransferase
MASPNLADMIREQAEELSVFKSLPLKIDFALYLRLEAIGRFKVFTARAGKTLIGYIPFYVATHSHHCDSLFATVDNFYVDPAWRHSSKAGLDLFRHAFAAVEALPGMAAIVVHCKLHKAVDRTSIGEFFKRRGFTPIETLYAKVVQR